jgi:hypothetical protein
VVGLEQVEVISPGVGEEVASLAGDLVLGEGGVEVAVEGGGALALDPDGDSHMGHILMLCHHMGDTIIR